MNTKLVELIYQHHRDCPCPGCPAVGKGLNCLLTDCPDDKLWCEELAGKIEEMEGEKT